MESLLILGTVALLHSACSLGPGFFLLRRSSAQPLVVLTASIGLSHIFLYLVSSAVYLLQLPQKTFLIVSLVSLGMLLRSRHDLAAFLKNREVRTAICFYWIAVAVTVCLSSFIRNYTGGHWFGDWLEHYERMLFFLERRSLDTTFIHGYLLPARPPMFNLNAGFYFAQLPQPIFAHYQIITACLSLLVFFPVTVIAAELAADRRARPGLCALLLCFNPFVFQNASYPWSKLYCAFFVLLGTFLYVQWREVRVRNRLNMAALFLAASLLIHYSAFPYALFAAMHLCIARPKPSIKDGFPAAAIAASLLTTWFAWTLITYGPEQTFLGNTSVQDASKYSGWTQLVKIAHNISASIVPFPLRLGLSAAGTPHNFWFLLYEGNLLLAVGSLNAILIAFACSRHRADALPARYHFWLGYVFAALFLGIGAHGSLDEFGLTHIALQPLALLGLSVVVAELPALSYIGRSLVFTGLAMDFLLGIALHVRAEFIQLDGPNWHLKNRAEHVFLGDVTFPVK